VQQDWICVFHPVQSIWRTWCRTPWHPPWAPESSPEKAGRSTWTRHQAMVCHQRNLFQLFVPYLVFR
jgi:hypothetical protein